MTNYSADIDHIFHALGDPTRRAVVERLANGSASVGDLAKPFGMALPSFMQHIRILEASSLIETEKVGRVRHCNLRQEAIDKIDEWTRDRRSMWEGRLGRLQSYLDNDQQQ